MQSKTQEKINSLSFQSFQLQNSFHTFSHILTISALICHKIKQEMLYQINFSSDMHQVITNPGNNPCVFFEQLGNTKTGNDKYHGFHPTSVFYRPFIIQYWVQQLTFLFVWERVLNGKFY